MSALTSCLEYQTRCRCVGGKNGGRGDPGCSCQSVLCWCHFDYDEGGAADEQGAYNYKHLIIAVLG